MRHIVDHPVVQALAVTIIALWLAGGVAVTARPSAITWALLAFAVLVAALAWWRVFQQRGDRS